MITPKGSMSTEVETLQISVLPYSFSICPPLVTGQMSILQIPRHITLSYSLSTPCFFTTAPSGETYKYATNPSTQKTNLERFSTYWYAPFYCGQPSSEIPEGLMNYPVFLDHQVSNLSYVNIFLFLLVSRFRVQLFKITYFCLSGTPKYS